MRDVEPLRDHPVHAVDHVVVTVMRKIALEPVRRLAGATAAKRIWDNDEVSAGIQRLALLEQLIGQGWPQPVCPGTGIALQQQYAVDDLA